MKEHVGARLEPEEVARIDALIGPMSEPGREVVRSQVIRLLILQALPVAEKVAAEKEGAGK